MLAAAGMVGKTIKDSNKMDQLSIPHRKMSTRAIRAAAIKPGLVGYFADRVWYRGEEISFELRQMACLFMGKKTCGNLRGLALFAGPILR